MERLLAPQFGELEFDPAQVIEFPSGLPAFENLRRFLLIEQSGSPIGALQSIERPEVCFPVVPIAAIVPDYQVEIGDQELEDLRGGSAGDLLALAIVSLTESGRPTANLLAPVLIHAGRRRGMQGVRSDAKYSHEHPLGRTEAEC